MLRALPCIEPCVLSPALISILWVFTVMTGVSGGGGALVLQFPLVGSAGPHPRGPGGGGLLGGRSPWEGLEGWGMSSVSPGRWSRAHSNTSSGVPLGSSTVCQ